jgi:hypothetical protein
MNAIGYKLLAIQKIVDAIAGNTNGAEQLKKLKG